MPQVYFSPFREERESPTQLFQQMLTNLPANIARRNELEDRKAKQVAQIERAMISGDMPLAPGMRVTDYGLKFDTPKQKRAFYDTLSKQFGSEDLSILEQQTVDQRLVGDRADTVITQTKEASQDPFTDALKLRTMGLADATARITGEFGGMRPFDTNLPASTIGAQQDSTQSATAQIDPVKAAQTALGVKADGKFGQKSVAALKKYQQDNGLTVTGTLDDATQTKMGIIPARPEAPVPISTLNVSSRAVRPTAENPQGVARTVTQNPAQPLPQPSAPVAPTTAPTTTTSTNEGRRQQRQSNMKAQSDLEQANYSYDAADYDIEIPQYFETTTTGRQAFFDTLKTPLKTLRAMKVLEDVSNQYGSADLKDTMYSDQVAQRKTDLANWATIMAAPAIQRALKEAKPMKVKIQGVKQAGTAKSKEEQKQQQIFVDARSGSTDPNAGIQELYVPTQSQVDGQQKKTISRFQNGYLLQPIMNIPIQSQNKKGNKFSWNEGAIANDWSAKIANIQGRLGNYQMLPKSGTNVSKNEVEVTNLETGAKFTVYANQGEWVMSATRGATQAEIELFANTLTTKIGSTESAVPPSPEKGNTP